MEEFRRQPLSLEEFGAAHLRETPETAALDPLNRYQGGGGIPDFSRHLHELAKALDSPTRPADQLRQRSTQTAAPASAPRAHRAPHTAQTRSVPPARLHTRSPPPSRPARGTAGAGQAHAHAAPPAR